MVTRRAFLFLVGAPGAAGVATVAGIELLPGDSAPTGDPVPSGTARRTAPAAV